MSEIADKVAQLVDMGFSAEQAMSALQKTQMNVESAISHLFGEEPDVIDTHLPPPTNDTVGVRNPQDIPDINSFHTVSHIEQENSTSSDDLTPEGERDITMVEDNMQESKMKQHLINNDKNMNKNMDCNMEASNLGSETGDYMDSDSTQELKHQLDYYDNKDTDIDEQMDADGISIFDKVDIHNYDTSLPKLIIPLAKNVHENCLVPFLVILSQISKFQQLIFDKSLVTKDYGWSKNWYKDEKINALTPTDISVSQVESFEFLVEIQRLVAFLLYKKSKRPCISTHSILRTFPRKSRQEIIETTLLEDIIPKLFETISFSMINVVEGDDLETKRIQSIIDELLISVAYNQENGMSNSVSHIEVEFGKSHKNLYDTFNELIWGNDFDQLGEEYFTKFGDILTITNSNDKYSTLSNFQILQEFYPQIYSDKYIDLLKFSIHERKINHMKRLELIKKLNELQFFEGKKLSKILEKTSEVLEGDAKNDLLLLNETIEQEKVTIREQVDTITNLLDENDVTNTENFVARILQGKYEQVDKNITPYILIGIIQSTTYYHYRKFNSDHWVSVRYLTDSYYKKKVEDVECQVYESFDKLKPKITDLNNTSFVYIKQDVWNSNTFDIEEMIPSGLKKFFERDNFSIEEQKHSATKDEDVSKGNEENSIDENEMSQSIHNDTVPIDSQKATSSTDLIADKYPMDN